MADFNPNYSGSYNYGQQQGYQPGAPGTVPSAQAAWAAQNPSPYGGTQQTQNAGQQLPPWLQQSPTVGSPTMGMNNMVRALMAGNYENQAARPTNVGSAATFSAGPDASVAPTPAPVMPPVSSQPPPAPGAISGPQAPAAGAMYSSLFAPPTGQPQMPPSMLSQPAPQSPAGGLPPGYGAGSPNYWGAQNAPLVMPTGPQPMGGGVTGAYAPPGAVQM